MANNTIYGLATINDSVTNSSGIGIQELVEKAGTSFASQAGGSIEMASLLALGFLGFGVYKAGADPDLAVASLAPLVYFMSMEGFLGAPQTFGVSMILVTAVLFIAGLVRFLR